MNAHSLQLLRHSALLLCIVSAVLFSCSRKSELPKNHIDYFRQNLKADMQPKQLQELFGIPEEQKSTDLSIYKFHLSDTSEVWVGYTDKIVYACSVDENHNLVEDIIQIEGK